MPTGKLFRDDAYLAACEARVLAVREGGGTVALDRTVFYPSGGGQPGGTGHLHRADVTVVHILDTRKAATAPDGVLHGRAPGEPLPQVGERVEAEIDWERRHRLMRMHTCLHLLSAVLPYPVTGGQVSDGKGRLDFDMSEAPPDKETIAARLNELIAGDHPVRPRWIEEAALAANPDLVKTMAVKPPAGAGRVRLVEIAGHDVQACGGTHVARTGEIGRVIVRKVESKGRQNRRVSLEFE